MNLSLLLLIFCKPLLSVQSSFQSLNDLLTIVLYIFKQLTIIWRYFEVGGSKLWENIGKRMAAAAVIKAKNRWEWGMKLDEIEHLGGTKELTIV